jgi:hypothetical protein
MGRTSRRLPEAQDEGYGGYGCESTVKGDGSFYHKQAGAAHIPRHVLSGLYCGAGTRRGSIGGDLRSRSCSGPYRANCFGQSMGRLQSASSRCGPHVIRIAKLQRSKPQHQAENSVGGSGPAAHGPTTQINPSGEQQHQHSGENASEVSILGVKPGEWLLSIVTLMLWGATVGLVRSADRTAERQLRAYFDLRSAVVEDFEVGKMPKVILSFKNVGQTPAIVWFSR